MPHPGNGTRVFAASYPGPTVVWPGNGTRVFVDSYDAMSYIHDDQ